MTAAVKWAKDETNAEDEESEAFLDMLICGEGWTDTTMDYDNNPQGMIRQERIDPLMMDVDPESRKRNFEDAKWVAYTRDLTKKEIKEMFPDLDMAELAIGPQNAASTTEVLVHDDDYEAFYRNDYSAQIGEPNTIPVTKYQCIKKKKVVYAQSPDGNVVELSERKYRRAKKYIQAMALKTVTVEKNVYKQYIIVGNQVAEKFDLGCDHFTLRAQTGLRDRNNKFWFGMVTIMRDPQMWANKWLSQIQHIINSNNKGGVFVESDAPTNFREFEENYAKPDSVLKVNPGKMGGIQERKPLEFPGGSEKLLQYAIDAIADTSGVSLEMLGMANRNQPIGLEESRKDSGVAVLATFFDSLRRYRKVQAKVMAYYVREYIADGRLIRVLGPEGAKYIPLIKDKMAFEYDIEIDDAPSSPRVKERTFAVCLKLIDYAIQMNAPVPPEVFDYAPLPADLAQKWKTLIMKNGQPTPEQQQQQQLQQNLQLRAAIQELAKGESEIEKIDSEVEKNYASALKDRSVGQEQAALAFEKFGELGEVSQEFQAEQQRKDLEVMLNHERELFEARLKHIREQAMAQMQPQQQSQSQIPPQQLDQLMQGAQ